MGADKAWGKTTLSSIRVIRAIRGLILPFGFSFFRLESPAVPYGDIRIFPISLAAG